MHALVSLRFAAPAGALCYRMAEVLDTRAAASQLVVRVLATGAVRRVSTTSVACAADDTTTTEEAQHAAL